jgi:hypothetical protein
MTLTILSSIGYTLKRSRGLASLTEENNGSRSRLQLEPNIQLFSINKGGGLHGDCKDEGEE